MVPTFSLPTWVPNALKLYVLQENNITCMFCSLSYEFFFIEDKITANCFKDEVTPSLKANGRLKFIKMWHLTM